MERRLKPVAQIAALTLWMLTLCVGVYAYNDAKTLGLKGKVQSIELPIGCYIEEIPFFGVKNMTFDRNGAIATIDGKPVAESQQWTIVRDATGRISKVINNDGYSVYTTVVAYDASGRIASCTTSLKDDNDGDVVYKFAYNSLGFVSRFVNKSTSSPRTYDFEYGNMDIYCNWLKRTYVETDGSVVVEDRVIKYWSAETAEKGGDDGDNRNQNVTSRYSSQQGKTRQNKQIIANEKTSDGTPGSLLTIICGANGRADRTTKMGSNVGMVYYKDPNYEIGQNETKTFVEPSADPKSPYYNIPWYLRVFAYKNYELDKIFVNGVDKTSQVKRIPPSLPRWVNELSFLSLGKITRNTVVTISFKEAFWTSDLRMHDLKGHVKKMTRNPYAPGRSDMFTITYTQDGTWATTQGQSLKSFFKQALERDSQGRITHLQSVLYDVVEDVYYYYDANGFVYKASYDYGLDGGWIEHRYYDSNGDVTKIEFTDMEGDGSDETSSYTITYKILSRDSHGNWTSRQEIKSDGTRYMTKRVITYW